MAVSGCPLIKLQTGRWRRDQYVVNLHCAVRPVSRKRGELHNMTLNKNCLFSTDMFSALSTDFLSKLPGAVKLVLWRHWMHVTHEVHHLVTSENQFHCTRLYIFLAYFVKSIDLQENNNTRRSFPWLKVSRHTQSSDGLHSNAIRLMIAYGMKFRVEIS